MKKTIQLLLFVALAAFSTGCASPYMVDRGRDAADILTVTVGGGLGVKGRLGPIQTGLILQGDAYGLRGGYFGDQCDGEAWLISPTHDVEVLVVGIEGYAPDSDIAVRRQKQFGAESAGPFIHKLSTHKPCPSYYTQCDVTAALGFSLRLGFNPGELLDFILGWSTIDIYNDDLERKKSNKVLEATSL